MSEGDFDVVKEALRRLGTVWFGGVAMQPGKPQGFGTVGEDDTPIFTLPGNPVSAYVSFEIFVLPAIRRMMGKLPYAGPPARARLTHGRQLARGQASRSCAAPTRPTAAARSSRPVGGHGSHLIGDLATSNCLIVVPRRRDRDRGRRHGAGAASSTRSSDGQDRQGRLTHVDEHGAARMVDVGDKPVTTRTASATGRVLVSPAVVELLRGEGVPKGDALAVARIAGIMGAKQTPALIPLCHR